jgi:hypothetical protein
MIRSPLRLFVLALTAVLAALVLPGTAQAAPYCGITWGSLAKTAGNHAPADLGDELSAVRTGRHTCFDRLVIDVTGATDLNSFDVRYVSQVTSDGSGFVVPLRGAADIQVTLASHNHNYRPANRNELANVSGYTTFRQVAWAGGFEGYSSVGLGVRARLPFRAFVLSGPGDTVRLVVDVAHRW